MIKNLRKEGFTIVELVIVIAVIAILAAILIPTFSSIVNKANATAVQAELKSIKTQYIAEAADDYNYDTDLNLVFKHAYNKGKIIYYLEESGSFIPAEGFNFKDNAPIEGVYFVPLQYKSGTDEWLFAEFAEGTVGVISYLGPEVYSYASLAQMRDLAYGGGKYDNNPLPTWKAIDSGYEVTGTLNYHDLTVTDNNPLDFLSTEHWFLKFSIMLPNDFAPTADTKIQVQSAVLAPSLVVLEFLDGSSDWIVGISPTENVTVTIDWVGNGTFFKGKTYFIDLFKVILAPKLTP